jgi:hypothetical protein
MTIPRFDLTFSYWILVWFLLYYYKLININPKWLLVLAGIENFVLLIIMIYRSYSLHDILLFIIINFFIKIIPLILLYNTTINKNDIKWYVIVILLFCLWLEINGLNIITYIKDNIKTLNERKFKGPMMKLLS